MAIPANFINPTGKQNLISSINQFMVDQIDGGFVYDGITTALPGGKDFFWFFDYPLSGLVFPSISTTEVGLFSLSPIAFDRVIELDKTTGKAIKGDRNQTLIEINCWAKDTPEKADATKVVRILRDRVHYVLKNAGEVDEDNPGQFIVPPIDLKDFSQSSPPVVGKVQVDLADNAIDEKFIVDAIDQNIKRYKLLVRMFWLELV